MATRRSWSSSPDLTPRIDAGATLADTRPALALAIAIGVYLLCTIALGYPALSGQFLVSPISDQFIGGFPVRNFAAVSLKAGQGIPTWNPYLFGGLPYIAAMHGDIFYPTFLLRGLLPTDVAMTWSFMIHIFLAGFFTYLFLRRCGLTFLPSLLGGVAYMMGGPVASLVSPGHDGKLYVSALLPLALTLLILGMRENRRWSWGALALVMGLGVLSPHPQLLQYMLLCCGAFSLYLAFASWKGEGPLPRNVALVRLGGAAVAVLLGALIGAVQYMPVFEYVPWSPRAGGRGYDYATSFSMPIEELFNTYLPQFTGILERYWGRNGIHFHSEYIGASVLYLAAAAFGGENNRALRRFWVGVIIVATLWALGGSTPFYHLIYAIVPGSKFFRAPSTIFFIVAFGIAVLAAFGVQRLMSEAVSKRFVIGWLGFGAAIALLASVGALTNVAQVIQSTTPFAGTARDSLPAANNAALIAGAWRSFLVLAVLAGATWATRDGKLTHRALGWTLVAVTALDLLSIEHQYWRFSPPASRLYASDPAIDYMKRGEPGRVIALALGAEPAPRDPFFEGDGLMVHQIRSALGYHGNELGRYQRLAGKSDTTDYSMREIFSPEFWRHENVRYLYTTADTNMMAQIAPQIGLTTPPRRLVGPVTNAAGSTVYLYRLPGDNPPAWVSTAAAKAPDNQTLATVLDPRFDPTRVTILDTSVTAIQPAPLSGLPAPSGIQATVNSMKDGAYDITLDKPATAGSALVVSENYFPGWHATADGKPVPVARTDFNLIGIGLPAGAKTIQVRFTDAAYEKGKTITLVSIALAIVLAGLGFVADRRRVAQASPA